MMLESHRASLVQVVDAFAAKTSRDGRPYGRHLPTTLEIKERLRPHYLMIVQLQTDYNISHGQIAAFLEVPPSTQVLRSLGLPGGRGGSAKGSSRDMKNPMTQEDYNLLRSLTNPWREAATSMTLKLLQEGPESRCSDCENIQRRSLSTTSRLLSQQSSQFKVILVL